ncbi:hypothetical protein EST38_g14063 [Candolleomyces aberdarensis]|uniref:Uncharacterized protein n=1 Tax=Candolleomyces aberdarensis TaxID=2316362 RepID=A0A4Q2CZE0_9AGAR|nr:hypothetical protein EST38_g14063 [Candolleomyces aberdarensis]
MDNISYRCLFMGVSRLQPHINAAFHDFDTCMNTDLANLCDHISFFLRHLAPEHFERVLGQTAGSWINTNTPTSRFGGLQTSGEADQVTGELPDLVPPSPPASAIASLVEPSGPSYEVISIHDTDDKAVPAMPVLSEAESMSTDDPDIKSDKLIDEEEEEEVACLKIKLPPAPSKSSADPSPDCSRL